MKKTDKTRKTVIVVGASGGLGRVLCDELSRAGLNLVLAARGLETLEKVASLLPPERTLVIPTDANDPEAVVELFQQARERFGRVDAVIISVGTWKQLSFGDPLDLATKLFDEHVRSLLRPNFIVGFVAAQFFNLQSGGGWIVNISSHAAIRPELPGNLTYGPLKAAGLHFMRALGAELVGSEVRVTDIEPAIINLPGNYDALGTPERRAKAVQPPAIAKWIIEQLGNPNPPTTKLFDSEVILP